MSKIPGYRSVEAGIVWPTFTSGTRKSISDTVPILCKGTLEIWKTYSEFSHVTLLYSLTLTTCPDFIQRDSSIHLHSSCGTFIPLLSAPMYLHFTTVIALAHAANPSHVIVALQEFQQSLKLLRHGFCVLTALKFCTTFPVVAFGNAWRP